SSPSLVFRRVHSLIDHGQADVLEHWHGFPLGASPGLVNHRHGVVFELDLKKSGKSKAGRVAHQGRAGVEADLVWQRWRVKRPANVQMSFAATVRADPGESGANVLIVVQTL